MRITIKIITALLLVLASASMYTRPAHAATGVIYISPATTSVQVGNTVSVQLRITPGTSVNAVQATVTYATADVQWVSTTLGAFSTCTKNTGGSGSVTLACAMLASSTSTDSLIATMTFKALVGSGSSTLQVTNANAANNGTYTNPTTANGTITLTSPPPAPTPAPVAPSAPPTHTYQPPVTSVPKKVVPSKPVVPQKVVIKMSPASVMYNTASLKVHTNVPTSAHLVYGTRKQAMSASTTPDTAAVDHTVRFPALLVPGTMYYYQIVVKDAAGTVAKSAIKTLTTKGYVVRVTVLNGKDQPLQHKVVTLHSTPMEATTDSNGVATFKGVAPGEHHLEYTDHSQLYSQIVYVANNIVIKGDSQTAEPQHAAVILTGLTPPSNAPTPLVAITVGSFVVAASIISALVRRYGFQEKHLLQRAEARLHMHTADTDGAHASEHDTAVPVSEKEKEQVSK